jgi:hypothetical protein
VLDILDHIPEELQDVAGYSLLDERTYEEIARLLGILSGTIGAPAGDPFTLDCGSRSLLVGVQGRAGEADVNKIQPLCMSATDISNGSTTGVFVGGFTGTTIGDLFVRRCPKNMAVKRVVVQTSSLVERMVLECERIDQGKVQLETSLQFHGGVGGTMFRERCPIGTVMTGLHGRAGQEVDRLGAMCRQVAAADVGGTRIVRMTGREDGIVIDGHSGFGGTAWSRDLCPSDMALIGLHLIAGARINRVKGICADAAKWSDERVVTGAVPTAGLNPRGSADGGGEASVFCPRQSFLSGWNIRAGSRVDGFAATCVRAED